MGLLSGRMLEGMCLKPAYPLMPIGHIPPSRRKTMMRCHNIMTGTVAGEPVGPPGVRMVRLVRKHSTIRVTSTPAEKRRCVSWTVRTGPVMRCENA